MLSRFSNSLWRAQRLTGLRIRNRKILKWEKRHRLLPGQGNDGFFFFFLLHFLEELLQCDDPFVKEIRHMSHVNTTSLLILQSCVTKSLEEKWRVLPSEGSGPFWSFSLSLESHNVQGGSQSFHRVHGQSRPTKKSLILNPLTYLPMSLPTYPRAHTHTLFICLKKEQYSIDPGRIG